MRRGRERQGGRSPSGEKGRGEQGRGFGASPSNVVDVDGGQRAKRAELLLLVLLM